MTAKINVFISLAEIKKCFKANSWTEIERVNIDNRLKDLLAEMILSKRKKIGVGKDGRYE